MWQGASGSTPSPCKTGTSMATGLHKDINNKAPIFKTGLQGVVALSFQERIQAM